MTGPTMRVLSLGAGVQSTALLIMSASGRLPKLDAAIFADTGWEPRAVYDHLDQIEREVSRPAGIPIYRVAKGNIRDDALAARRSASLPLYILNGDGSKGIARRQCTGEYKLAPIRRKVRDLLGYPHPRRVPDGVFVELWIGISTDERDRAVDKDAGELKLGDVRFAVNRYPLLEAGMSRDACMTLNVAAGFPDTPKSACIGCPYHANPMWRDMRDNHPDEWADAVAFDTAIRERTDAGRMAGLDGQPFLHRSNIPLGEAPIDRVTFREWAGRQTDLMHMLTISEYEEDLADDGVSITGCSPFACERGDPEYEGDDADE